MSQADTPASLTMHSANCMYGRTLQPLGTLEGTFQLLFASDACNASHGCRSDPFTVRIGQ